MLATRTWHVQRLFFLISARDHFLEDLKDEGFQVTLIRSPDTAAGIAQYRSANPGSDLIAAEPSSHQQRLRSLPNIVYFEIELKLGKN